MTIKESPLILFREWYELARKESQDTCNILTLSTATTDAKVSSRIVLLKDFDENGFVFYTNLKSRKGQELAQNPNACMCFYWHEIQKQVRLEGLVERVSDEEADEYFASRPRKAQIGAWASKQSANCGELDLEKRVAKFTAKFLIGKVPRPLFWGGFRLKPQSVEFWQAKNFRLHTRFRSVLQGGNWTLGWVKEKLFP